MGKKNGRQVFKKIRFQMIANIPCGGITEIVGPPWYSVGRKSLQAQLLVHAAREQFCALIYANDSFDPRSAKTAGVNLERVLWIRGGGHGVKALEQAFKASDLLLQGSAGFGLIMVDLAGISERLVRKVPLTTWFRFRSVTEKETGHANVIVMPDVYSLDPMVVLHERFVQVKERVQNQDGVVHLRAERISPLSVSTAVTQSHDFH